MPETNIISPNPNANKDTAENSGSGSKLSLSKIPTWVILPSGVLFVIGAVWTYQAFIKKS